MMVIAHRDIARSIRFQPHVSLTACWIWTGTFKAGLPIVSATGLSARHDVYERMLGTRHDGHLRIRCGRDACVNPHHTKPAAAVAGTDQEAGK